MHLAQFLPYLISPLGPSRRLAIPSVRWAAARFVASYALLAVSILLLAKFLGYGKEWIHPWRGGWEVKVFVFEIWFQISFMTLSSAWIVLCLSWSARSKNYLQPRSTESTAPGSITLSPRSLVDDCVLSTFLTPRHSYAVFLIHPIILTLIMAQMDHILVWSFWGGEWGCTFKAFLTGTLAVVVAWRAAKVLVGLRWIGAII
jgi:hypothetical protein